VTAVVAFAASVFAAIPQRAEEAPLPRSISEWLTVLSEPTSDWEDRTRARTALLLQIRDGGDPALERALPVLRDLLDDARSNPESAEAAAELMGALGHRAAALPLSRLLAAPLPESDHHAAAVQAAARAIGRLGGDDPIVISRLEEAAGRSPHAGVRGEALEALARLAPVAVSVPALLAALADPVGEVRFLASLGLARIGPPAASAAPRLRALLDGDARPHGHFLAWIEAEYPRDADDLRCLAGAAAALLALGDERGLEALRRYLDHPDWLVRRSAMDALWASREGTGSETVALLLAERLDDPNSAIRHRTLEHLRSMGRPAASAWTAVSERALQDPDPGVRAAALRAARALETPDLVTPLLTDRLRDPDPGVRREAEQLLTELAR
jgi:HEAT repeat protein